MDRYTSPALSRDLAAAGLEQYEEDHELTRSWWGRYERDNEDLLWSTWGAGRSLALDLTDVLAEIETRGATWLVETDGDTYCATLVGKPDSQFSAVMSGPTAVEAAGLCLLALLDKETAADIDLSMRRSMDSERAKP